MNIDLEKYIMNDIGHTDWYGETNYDKESLENLTKLDEYLNVLEDIRQNLIFKLEHHIGYRKGSGSAESLHIKAKEIHKKHLIKEFTHTDFDQYWEGE